MKDRLLDVLVIYSAINSFNRYVSSVTTIWLTWPSNDDTIVAAAAADAAAVATDNTTVVQNVTEKRVAVPTVHVVMPGTHVEVVSWLLSGCV